jgi:CheY-like chemotaxis protein
MSTADPPGQEKPGVLVVDDEPQVRRLLEVALTRKGMTVWTAADGRAAVEIYRQHRDRIRMVLLDVQMPGQDGPWTLVELQKVNPQVRAVFISGNSGQYHAELLLALGAAAVLSKPFTLAELDRTIGQLLPD